MATFLALITHLTERYLVQLVAMFMQGTTREEMAVLEQQAPAEMHKSQGN